MNIFTGRKKYFTLPKLFYFFLLVMVSLKAASAQEVKDSNAAKDWSVHFQETIITQYHPAFNAKYSGDNSLNPGEETKTSLTTTLFLGRKLWSNAEAYFNAEVAGGEGFSGTTGAAGFPNGEVYRVGDPKPQFNLARLFVKQIFPLSDKYTEINDDINQFKTGIPDSYISLSIGRFSIIDFFDKNSYSNDPRTQFMNWSLMDNGAWDYPADTKGYTSGIECEYTRPDWAFRIVTAMVPKTANGMEMEYNIKSDHSEAVEIEHDYSISNFHGTVRVLFFLTHADMGNYLLASNLPEGNVNVENTKQEGRTKYGIGINVEQALSENTGAFLRLGWNNGKNETWMFTEIDRTVSGGLLFNGSIWARKDDNAGIAFAVNGISQDHRNYLRAGGSGFIIGDGNLNYASEMLLETFYSYKAFAFLQVSPDYQLIVNPAYNKDRGPVNVFSARFHVEI